MAVALRDRGTGNKLCFQLEKRLEFQLSLMYDKSKHILATDKTDVQYDHTILNIILLLWDSG